MTGYLDVTKQKKKDLLHSFHITRLMCCLVLLLTISLQLVATHKKSFKKHEWERYGYSHLFSMNREKILPYIGKSMETCFPYLGIVWVF